MQRTIKNEFSSSTLLCVAHRLNTIGEFSPPPFSFVGSLMLTESFYGSVYYDRILVMDAGKVAEFDTPLNLFDNEDSIFRSLCNEAKLSRQDIVKIRASAQGEPLPFPESSSAFIT